jgi:tungstate transport system substrate-binding protein
MRASACWLAPALLIVPLLAGCAAPAPAAKGTANGTAPSSGAPLQRMVLATTTSTKDTGLLDAILPNFSAMYHVDVNVVAVGTGRALELGRTGDADVVLVHAPPTERAYLKNGSYTTRYEVMYNQFFLVGPASEPRHINDTPNITAAFRAIHDRAATFVSRGDQSGTHLKEQALWAQAGFNYSRDIAIPANAWYQSVGQGMAATLRIASQQQGYTLSDDGTWYATSPPGMAIVKQNEPPLLNQYSVMLINATRNPGIRADLAQDFASWMTSNATLARIAAYEVNGHRLFTPDAGVVEHG